MKLKVTGFKSAPESDDQVYFFKASMPEDLFFELTNKEIAELVGDPDCPYLLPERFDFGMREPMICQMLIWLHTTYWKDEDGILEGCAIELTPPQK